MTTTTIRRILAGLAALAVSLTATVRADEGAPPPNTVGHSPPSDTYTRQILTADAASIAALVAAGAIDAAGSDDTVANGLSLVAVGGLMVGAPIVHAAHDHWGRAVVSLGMRLGLTTLGANVGFGLAECEEGQFLCGIGEAAIGAGAGMATAMAIDAAVLARLSESEAPPAHEPETPSPGRVRSPGFSLAPSLVATPQLAFVGVGGRFP